MYIVDNCYGRHVCHCHCRCSRRRYCPYCGAYLDGWFHRWPYYTPCSPTLGTTGVTTTLTGAASGSVTTTTTVTFNKPSLSKSRSARW